jgi:hypothetical protein
MADTRDHGPLPGLLAGLTAVTGLVDAFSYLTLGHVFVANMTGNVVFFGFALAGTGGISVAGSLLSVLAFAVGAALGGRLATAHPPHRGYLLAAATGIQGFLVLAAATLASAADVTHTLVRLILIGLLAVAMGGQNAVVRRLGVPGPYHDSAHPHRHRACRRPSADAGPAPADHRRSCHAGGRAARRRTAALGGHCRPVVAGRRDAGHDRGSRVHRGQAPRLGRLAISLRDARTPFR